MDKTNLVNTEKKPPETLLDNIDDNSNPDAKLRLDEEDDSLYNDGLNVDKDAAGLIGTRGQTPGIAKP
jgi:hypothetical protein